MPPAGFVLAGGQSRRMGRDKALLPWGDHVLLQHVCERVARVSETVTVVGAPSIYGRLGLPCIADLRPGLGPLSGIEAALASGQSSDNLVLACDMPEVNLDHLRRLSAVTSADCVVTQDVEGRIHPLCAIYRSSCLARVRAALDERRLKLLALVNELSPAIVRYPGTLHNINTVEDILSVR